MNCPYCEYEIREDDTNYIYGVANVEGFTSIKGFKEKGVEWEARDSWDEYIKCPHCDNKITLYGEKVED